MEPQTTIGENNRSKKQSQTRYLPFLTVWLVGLRHETQRIIECHERLMLGFTYVQPNLLNSIISSNCGVRVVNPNPNGRPFHVIITNQDATPTHPAIVDYKTAVTGRTSRATC